MMACNKTSENLGLISGCFLIVTVPPHQILVRLENAPPKKGAAGLRWMVLGGRRLMVNAGLLKNKPFT